MGKHFISDDPKATLIGITSGISENERGVELKLIPTTAYAVGSARTCYSQTPVFPDQPAKPEVAERILAGTREAGHLTTRQHVHLTYMLENVSRQATWSFLHSHPFYNSEQVSQRYVRMKDKFTIPQLEGRALEVYLNAVQAQFDAYESLRTVLTPVAREFYYDIFKARKNKVSSSGKEKYLGAIEKKAQEVARYAAGVNAHAFMYHTVSALTLMRYYQSSEFLDAPLEQQVLVDSMVAELRKIDPEFERAELRNKLHADNQQMRLDFTAAKRFAQEFDCSLEGKVSRLVDYKINAVETVACAVREILGKTKGELGNETAIDILLNPAKNRLLGDVTNLTTMDKLSRAMFHAHYTFRKKLSHTADSQDQRHRMTPASRPIICNQYAGEPDFIVPALVKESTEAMRIYQTSMERTFAAINQLLGSGINPEKAFYLLPNAFPIRFTESGDLLNLHHKWKLRLCYNAQEEIFNASLDEVKEVAEVHPEIAKYIGAPCMLRFMSHTQPYCPEGDRYCGVPVWKLAVNDYKRII
ncbi:FAD-dependent thymidylate synthase [Candidatus Woesearchaeota archaeon]|nr:FAD-dependent thymidylate synthase [Candidatus Woesearchaeota archaeon]